MARAAPRSGGVARPAQETGTAFLARSASDADMRSTAGNGGTAQVDPYRGPLRVEGGGRDSGRGCWVKRSQGPRREAVGFRAQRETRTLFSRARRAKRAESSDKPGSVRHGCPRRDSHSSRRRVTAALEQPTRRHRGPRHRLPIWSCSRWGLPCRSVAGLAVRSYRTISPLPSCSRSLGRYLSVALSVGSRRPGVTWHRALWSPDFPRHAHARRDCLDDSAARSLRDRTGKVMNEGSTATGRVDAVRRRAQRPSASL
jgi:hypothetical protein